MARTETKYSIFIASPSDVARERDLIVEIVDELNITFRPKGIQFEVLRWENDVRPAIGDYAQAVVNDQIGDAYDIFLGIIWKTMGTVTPVAESGTLEEYERAHSRFRESGVPEIMIYFKETPLTPSEYNPEQMIKVKAFRQRLKADGALYGSFDKEEELARSIRLHLNKFLSGLETEKKMKPTTSPPASSKEDVGGDGFLDLEESASKNFQSAVDCIDEITKSMSELSEKISKKAEKLQGRNFVNAPNNIKRALIDEAARDMREFCEILDFEVPKFSKHFETGIDDYIRAVTLSVQIGKDSQHVFPVLESLKTMRENITSSAVKISNFHKIVDDLPPMTTALVTAKRHLTGRLESQILSLKTAEELSARAEADLQKLID